MKFMGFALREGFSVMCSDFSLKSLLFEWSAEELGPNPFLKVGSCSTKFCLDFIPSELQHEDVPQQLQVVGELCADRGKAIVLAMGDTIVYTVNPERPSTHAYELKVLTVVSEMANSNLVERAAGSCSVGIGEDAKNGYAGHVSLTYPSGGQLVTSTGHWIELSRIDTSLESVMQVARKNFGAQEARDLCAELAVAVSESERSDVIQRRASAMITKSMPSKMKSRTKF